jgi:hypothetical protein
VSVRYTPVILHMCSMTGICTDSSTLCLASSSKVYVPSCCFLFNHKVSYACGTPHTILAHKCCEVILVPDMGAHTTLFCCSNSTH